MPKEMKRIAVGLFISLIFGYGTLIVPLRASTETHKLDQEISLEDNFIRIIKKNAVFKVTPSNDGVVIKKLPLGALFEVEEELDEWLKIKLPPDKDGFLLTGFIHKSYTEASSTIHK